MTRPPYSWPNPDREYANSEFIEGSADNADRWMREAESYRQSLGPRAELGLAYGEGERNLYDVFSPEGSARGTVIFIHGGWWLSFGREFWSHLAAGPLARGWRVVMPSYTLAPKARISQITEEMAHLTRQVLRDFSGPVIATGHSAGGHLSARLGCLDLNLPLARVVPISPLTELGPLLALTTNRSLRLTEEETARESPARLKLRPGTSAHVHVGGDERPSFLAQARILSEEWDVPWSVAPGKHHFDVIDALAEPDSDLTNTLLAI